MGMKKYEKKIRGNQDQKTVAKQQKGQRHRDYQQYQFRFMDWMEYIFWLLLKGGLICYLFYDSPKAAILLIPMGILDYRRLKKKKLEKQKQELTLQFKSMIEAIAMRVILWNIPLRLQKKICLWPIMGRRLYLRSFLLFYPG